MYVRGGLFEKSRELLNELEALGYAEEEVIHKGNFVKSLKEKEKEYKSILILFTKHCNFIYRCHTVC